MASQASIPAGPAEAALSPAGRATVAARAEALRPAERERVAEAVRAVEGGPDAVIRARRLPMLALVPVGFAFAVGAAFVVGVGRSQLLPFGWFEVLAGIAGVVLFGPVLWTVALSRLLARREIRLARDGLTFVRGRRSLLVPWTRLRRVSAFGTDTGGVLVLADGDEDAVAALSDLVRLRLHPDGTPRPTWSGRLTAAANRSLGANGVYVTWTERDCSSGCLRAMLEAGKRRDIDRRKALKAAAEA